jgi:hypothetical protein
MKRGRPKINDSVVLVRLPAKLHDDVCTEAHREGESVSAVIRRRLLSAPRISTNRHDHKTA